AQGQRLQQDLEALAAGAGDPTAIAQRVADSADYLSQVLRGLAGGGTGLGIPPVRGAHAPQHLKGGQGLFHEINDPARGAGAATQALIPIQSASLALNDAAQKLAVHVPELRAAAGAGTDESGGMLGRTVPLILLGVGLLAVVGSAVLYTSAAN